jgi:mono/diheme cytochrome c family protein
MVKSLLVISTMIAFGAAFAATPGAGTREISATAVAGMAGPGNPVKPTAESQAKAKKTYGFDCALCHGENGDGKTDLAKDMQLTMTDLTDPKTLTGKSDADLFDLIRKGKDKMPPEEAARAKDDDVWNLVIYVRGLAKGGTTTAEK